jgi:hypothetical protein
MTERVAVPPLPLQASVNVLVAASGPTLWEPAVDLLPLHAPEAEHELALEDDQLSVDEAPLETVAGLALRETDGAAGAGDGADGGDTGAVSGPDDPPPPQPAAITVASITNENLLTLSIIRLPFTTPDRPPTCPAHGSSFIDYCRGTTAHCGSTS